MAHMFKFNGRLGRRRRRRRRLYRRLTTDCDNEIDRLICTRANARARESRLALQSNLVALGRRTIDPTPIVHSSRLASVKFISGCEFEDVNFAKLVRVLCAPLFRSHERIHVMFRRSPQWMRSCDFSTVARI